MESRGLYDGTSFRIKECSVDLQQADFFITHMHADHSGLVSTLAVEEARIYFGWADAEIIKSSTPEHWEKLIDFARKCGFPGEELEKAMGSHPGRRYSPNTSLNLCVFKGRRYDKHRGLPI